MNEYQDKLMKEARELERNAKEERKLALMTPQEKRAYLYGLQLESLRVENIFWAGGKKDG